MLGTAGGLVFVGRNDGRLTALDSDSGRKLWEFQTGAGMNATASTFEHKGKQYVTVLSGIGGLYWNVNRERLKDLVPQGGSVWTFALLPD